MTPTATPEADPAAPGTRRLSWFHLAAVVVALAATVMVLARARPSSDGPEQAEPTTTQATPVEVTSDAPTYATLEELIAASDLVVRGTVSDVQEGRWFGDGSSGSRIRSRMVTLDVESTLVGDPSGAGSLLVEEEGWTEDGHPLVVDGAAPTAEGDEGIWFLVDPGDQTTGALIVVNAQGRYLVGPTDRLEGAAGDDPLVTALSSETIDELAARISRTAPPP